MSDVFVSQVVRAYAMAQRTDQPAQTPIEYLVAWTGKHAAVCLVAINQAMLDGYIEFLPPPEGVVDPTYGQLTPKGFNLLPSAEQMIYEFRVNPKESPNPVD